MLIIAIPDTFNVGQMIKTARLLNPKIEILIRTHNEEEAKLLMQETAQKVFIGEDELAKNIVNHVLERYGLQ